MGHVNVEGEEDLSGSCPIMGWFSSEMVEFGVDMSLQTLTRVGLDLGFVCACGNPAHLFN